MLPQAEKKHRGRLTHHSDIQQEITGLLVSWEALLPAPNGADLFGHAALLAPKNRPLKGPGNRQPCSGSNESGQGAHWPSVAGLSASLETFQVVTELPSRQSGRSPVSNAAPTIQGSE